MHQQRDVHSRLSPALGCTPSVWGSPHHSDQRSDHVALQTSGNTGDCQAGMAGQYIPQDGAGQVFRLVNQVESLPLIVRPRPAHPKRCSFSNLKQAHQIGRRFTPDFSPSLVSWSPFLPLTIHLRGFSGKTIVGLCRTWVVSVQMYIYNLHTCTCVSVQTYMHIFIDIHVCVILCASA